MTVECIDKTTNYILVVDNT